MQDWEKKNVRSSSRFVLHWLISSYPTPEAKRNELVVDSSSLNNSYIANVYFQFLLSRTKNFISISAITVIFSYVTQPKRVKNKHDRKSIWIVLVLFFHHVASNDFENTVGQFGQYWLTFVMIPGWFWSWKSTAKGGGVLKDYDKNRGINLLSVISKMYVKLIWDRVVESTGMGKGEMPSGL